MPDRLRWSLVVVVTAVWSINVIAPIFVPTYVPSAEVNVAFLTVMGVLLAAPGRGKEEKREQKKEGRTKGDNG